MSFESRILHLTEETTILSNITVGKLSEFFHNDSTISINLVLALNNKYFALATM